MQKIRKIIPNTPEEEAAIQRGIAQDPDTFELDDAFFAEAKRPDAAFLKKIGYRGAQKSPTKVAISIKLDRDILEALKASGKGWQTRVNAMLRRDLGV